MITVFANVYTYIKLIILIKQGVFSVLAACIICGGVICILFSGGETYRKNKCNKDNFSRKILKKRIIFFHDTPEQDSF